MMLAPLLLTLSALSECVAADFSPYQWRPLYQQPEGQLFHPRVDYGPTAQGGVSPRDSYLDVLNYRDSPESLGYGPEGLTDRRFLRPVYGPPGYDDYHRHVFEDRVHRPSYHGPPPHDHYNHDHYNHGHYNHGSWYHNRDRDQPERNWAQRPQEYNPASTDSQGSPDRNGFNGRPQPPRRQSFQDRPTGGSRTSSPLEVVYSWRLVDFEFPNDNLREEMIRNQQFIPKNNLILDMDVYGEGREQRVWVTLPRVRPGVPVTLATVSPRSRRDTALLRPFPDWRSHRPGDCENSITSVFRTHVDQCGRLWVLDSGNNNAFATGQSRLVCPPQILIYDLNNDDQLIGKYRFPSSMIANTSLLVTINVDSRTQDCGDSVAYIADSMNFKLLAFRQQTGQFWSMNSDLFRPYPDQTMFSVNGVSFQLSGGIFGLALGPLVRGDRQLYFHCIDSIKQSVVDTADILDPRPWLDSVDANPRVFRELNGSRSSQSAAAAMTDQGVMFFGLIGSNEMACWDSRTDFGRENIIILAKDDTNLQFNSGIKVFGGRLFVVTSRLQNYIQDQVPEDEVNYRILAADLRTLTRGTPCDRPDYRDSFRY